MASESRVLRLLSLVAFLERRADEGAQIKELAAHFGVSETQIRKDIDLLWMTGRPGYMPDDLIDFDAFGYETEHIRLRASQSVGQPLRLTEREQVALLLAVTLLQQSAQATGEEQVLELLNGVISQLEGAAENRGTTLDVRAVDDVDPGLTKQLRNAITLAHYVRLEYVNSHGRRSTPVLEPHRLEVGEPHTYLLATPRADDAHARWYRLDRVVSAEVLDEAFQPRSVKGVSTWLYGNDTASGTPVELVVEPELQWLGEKYPGGEVEVAGGQARVRLSIHEDEWLARLILSYADRIHQVDPASAARDAASRAAAALAAYDRAGLIG